MKAYSNFMNNIAKFLTLKDWDFWTYFFSGVGSQYDPPSYSKKN